LSFDILTSLRRLKPEKRSGPLSRRNDNELPFVEYTATVGQPLMLDTTVYIDTLQKRLPQDVKDILVIRQNNHSSVAVAELAHTLGRLDPTHSDTATNCKAVQKAISIIQSHRLTAPSVQAMAEAGILVGTIARLHGLPKTDKQPLFNDAVLFLQALEQGCCLLTRNIGDMDYLQQLLPTGRILLYRQTN
jgi:hypothetical protein